MKKIILISGLVLSVIATPALANGCPSNYCAVTIHNGIETWTDAPKVEIAEPIIKLPTNNVAQVTLSDGIKGGAIYGDQAGVERFAQMLGLDTQINVVPNGQPYVAPISIINQSIDTATIPTIVTALSDVVMVTKNGIKITKKENAKVLIRKKKK